MKRTTNGRINICAAGNSLTAGNNPGLPWPTQFRDLVGVHVDIVNQGYGGQTSTFLLSIYDSTLRTFLSRKAQRNVMVISEVRNEMGYGATPREAVDALWALVARAIRGGWEVWVCTVIDTNPIGFTNGDRLLANQYIIAEAAANGCQVIDMAAVPALSNRANLTYFHTDEIHLVTAGYRAWAEAVATALGLLATPPQHAYLRACWRALSGVTEVLGEASSWASGILGTLTGVTVAGSRPEIVTDERLGKLLRLNGASDRLTFGALEALGTRASLAAWVKIPATISTDDTLFSSAGLGGGYFDLGTFINERWIGSVAGATAGSMNGSLDGVIRKDTWQFVCMVYDGTQVAQADRLKIYVLEHGEAVATLQSQVVGGTIPDSITAGAGDGAVGGLVGLSRQLPYDTTEMLLWKGAALTPTQVVDAAKIYDPLVGKPTVEFLGDSILLGVGDQLVDTGTADLGGCRGRMLELAGDQEAWWCHGHIRNGINANNRCACVGGSQINEHLTQWNTALAAGAAPEYVFYMGGRNDLSFGEPQAILDSRWITLFNAVTANTTVKKMFVSTIIPDSVNSLATRIANESLRQIVKAYSKIVLVEGFAALSYLTDLYDSVHPNSGGYWKLAQVFYDAFRAEYPALPRRWRNPALLTGLRGWWDASRGLTVSGGQAIATLQDARGQGRVLTKTNDGSLTFAPQRAAGIGKGGKTVAVFGSTSAPLRGVWQAADWVGGDSSTVVIAAQIREGAQAALYDSEPTTAATNQGKAVFREGSFLKARRTITDTIVADTFSGWRVITAVFTPAAATLRVNGVQVNTIAIGVTIADLVNVQLGSLFTGVYPLVGCIGEVVVASGALATHDLLRIERYMMERWVGARLPHENSLFMWLDSTFGVTVSGGVVDSWASRVGTALFTAAGALRPAYTSNYVEFDGIDDVLTRTADAQSHPVSQTRYTFLLWVWLDTAPLQVAFSTATYSSGTALQLSATIQQGFITGGSEQRFVVVPPTGAWVCYALTFNGARASGSRMVLYRGDLLAPMRAVGVNQSDVSTDTGIAAGLSSVGAWAGLGRYFDGRIKHVMQWNEELTRAEIEQAAAITRPTGGLVTVVPEYDSLILWMDAAFGITESGGLVSAWVSHVGLAVFSAAGSARPTVTGGYIDFNGTTNELTRLADAASHPAGATRVTVAMWVWADSIAASLRCPFATAPEANGGLWWQVTSAINVQYGLVGTDAAAATTRSFTEAGWRFVAWTFDGSLAPGSRCIQYYGTSVDTIAAVPGSDGVAATTIAAAGGNSSIGVDSTYARRWDGRVSSIYVYSGAALSLARLKELAAVKVPT